MTSFRVLVRKDARAVRARTGFSIHDCVQIAADELRREAAEESAWFAEHAQRERDLDDMAAE